MASDFPVGTRVPMVTDPLMSTPETWTGEAHDVITAELVACTMGQRHRPELEAETESVVQQFLQAARILRAYRERTAPMRAALAHLARAVDTEGDPASKPAKSLQ